MNKIRLIKLLFAFILTGCNLFSQGLKYEVDKISSRKYKVNITYYNGYISNNYITNYSNIDPHITYKIFEHERDVVIFDFNCSPFGRFVTTNYTEDLKTCQGLPIGEFKTVEIRFKFKLPSNSTNLKIYFCFRVLNKCSNLGTAYLIPLYGSNELVTREITNLKAPVYP